MKTQYRLSQSRETIALQFGIGPKCAGEFGCFRRGPPYHNTVLRMYDAFRERIYEVFRRQLRAENRPLQKLFVEFVANNWDVESSRCSRGRTYSSRISSLDSALNQGPSGAPVLPMRKSQKILWRRPVINTWYSELRKKHRTPVRRLGAVQNVAPSLSRTARTRQKSIYETKFYRNNYYTE